MTRETLWVRAKDEKSVSGVSGLLSSSMSVGQTANMYCCRPSGGLVVVLKIYAGDYEFWWRRSQVSDDQGRYTTVVVRRETTRSLRIRICRLVPVGDVFGQSISLRCQMVTLVANTTASPFLSANTKSPEPCIKHQKQLLLLFPLRG